LTAILVCHKTSTALM